MGCSALGTAWRFMTRRLAQPLGAGGGHILGVEHVQQVAAHDAHVAGHAAQTGDQDHRPDVAEQIDKLAPRPGRHRIFGREERGEVMLVKGKDQQIQNDQRHKEARH